MGGRLALACCDSRITNISISGQLVFTGFSMLHWPCGSSTEVQLARYRQRASRAWWARPSTYLYPVHEGRQALGSMLRAGARSSPDPEHT